MAIRQKIVVFTGAGISKESGIPTFRDANGMWKKFDAKKLASAAQVLRKTLRPCSISTTPEGRISWRCSPIMPTGCWWSWRSITT